MDFPGCDRDIQKIRSGNLSFKEQPSPLLGSLGRCKDQILEETHSEEDNIEG